MSAPTPSLLHPRQSLHLHIDPFTYKSEIRASPRSPSPSSSVNPAGTGEDATPSGGYDGSSICSILCMFDFTSDDPDHLPFSKNEILAIVKQEESGWWAAMRSDTEIGWIPQAFVERISEDMAERLRNTKKELRCFEYNAEQLYVSAPTEPIPPLYEPVEPPTPAPPSPRRLRRDYDAPAPQLYLSKKAQDLVQTGLDSESQYRLMFRYLRHDQPNPSHPTPSLQPPYTSSYYTKPSPFLSPTEQDPPQTRNRAGTLPSTGVSVVRRDDPPPQTRLRALYESNSSGEADSSTSRPKNKTDGIKRTRSQRLKVSMALDEIAPPRSNQAWYLKPTYSDQLDVDTDGHIRYGTLQALVEKLTSEAALLDTQKMAEENLFRNIFLMTFRTFTTADMFFDMLVDTYRMDHPKDLATAEFDEWKGHLIATQRRVLMIFTMWLEDHRLLEEEPHIAQKLTDFLRLILSPPLASMARLLQKTIQRLTFATPTISPTASPKKMRRSRAHKNDLLRLDAADIAEQFTLLEFKHYVKVTPQECLQHGGKATRENNLSLFCSTHDKIVTWVKISVLSNEALGKRANTIDFWIKVAEKCKSLNNFATMSAIINALSSTVITRLHLTWAHVGRKTTLDALLRYSEPTGGFAGYRSLLQNVEGPCIPFISMFLTDLVHIQDHYTDEGERICFLQRQRSFETINWMLRYQSRSYYDIAESDLTTSFIWRHLQEDTSKDNNWFWAKSQEVQQLELAHADIRKGLEAAGF